MSRLRRLGRYSGWAATKMPRLRRSRMVMTGAPNIHGRFRLRRSPTALGQVFGMCCYKDAAPTALAKGHDGRPECSRRFPSSPIDSTIATLCQCRGRLALAPRALGSAGSVGAQIFVARAAKCRQAPSGAASSAVSARGNLGSERSTIRRKPPVIGGVYHMGTCPFRYRRWTR